MDNDHSRSTRYSFPSKPGETLPNGATIISDHVMDEKEITFYQATEAFGAPVGVWSKKIPAIQRISVVLALIPGNHEPFVTWSRWITFDKETKEVLVQDTTSGHYHRHIDKAVRDLRQRTKAVK